MLPRLDHMIGRLARKPLAWVIVLALAAGGVAGLYWLQPWKLFTSSTLNEALPGVDSRPSASTGPTPGTATPRSGGTLKANKGNQVYDVPLDTSLDGLIRVTIWCKRFSVSFGAAELRKP